MTTGLIFIPVSVMQMLRGSMVIFSAIFTILILKRKVPAFEWLSVLICSVALVLVGASSIANSDASEYGPGYQLLGCGLVIGSQIVQALQIIIEEILLADVKLPSLVVVGMEGVWGSLMCIVSFIPLFYFIPGNDHDHYEDTYDTFYKLFHDKTIAITSAIYFVSILFLNMGGMMVTQALSAVHRTIFEALRTFFIWITSLIIYYAFTKDKGESWSNWSYMEAVGFIILVFSTLIHNKVIKFTACFTYPEDEEAGKTSDLPADDQEEAQPLLS